MFNLPSQFKLKQVSEELHNYKKQLSEAQKTIAELREENSNYKESIENNITVKYSLDAQIVNLKNQHNIEIKKMQDMHNEVINKMQKKMVEVEKSLNKRVNTALANVGIDSSFINDSVTDGISKDVSQKLAVFQSLTGAEKTEYYNKNKQDIDRAYGLI